MMSDMIFKFFRTIYIVVISLFTHDNIRSRNYILNIYYLLDSFIRVYSIWIWSHKINSQNSDLSDYLILEIIF